ALVCMAVSSACALAAEPAGSVSFVIGDASVLGDDGKSRVVSRGDSIGAGEILQTGATGHIHLRMVDGAFVSIRPQSRLRIEDYKYDAANPANNRIKFVLEKGVARSITGRAGEASKENYRLNTPLAAIGIRGTDFVVHATVDVTRVTVQSGAVVMAPLTADCLASTLGPCKSAASRVLTAAMRDAYLELRNRNEAPLLVPAEKALESPNLLAPPRPEEPRATADKQAKSNAGTDSRDAIREVALDSIKNQVDAVIPSPNPVTPTPSTPVVVSPPPPAKFWWGRWSPYIGKGEDAARFPDDPNSLGRTIASANTVFWLLRENSDLQQTVLPNTGVAKFQLAGSEAYMMQDRKTLTAAQVTSPSLTIDFGARRYDTSLTVNSEGHAPVLVQSAGKVTHQGIFMADPNTTGTTLEGMLSRNADQAAYVFQRDVSNGVSVVGATRWTR
ncbi:MAG: FecR family protein, partial [Noviherbaspirillum sp.]